MGIKASKYNDSSTISSSVNFLKDDGESETFGAEIFEELNRAYENRLHYFDRVIGRDCAELKYPIYKDWVNDLIVQNKKFIQILDELEREARKFVIRGPKLKGDIESCDSDNGFQKLENDLKNLLKLIHRALETNKWNVDGLEFQTLTIEDIFGKFLKMNETGSVIRISAASTNSESENYITELKCEMDRLKTELKRKNCVIEEYQRPVQNEQLDCIPSCGNDSKLEL